MSDISASVVQHLQRNDDGDSFSDDGERYQPPTEEELIMHQLHRDLMDPESFPRTALSHITERTERSRPSSGEGVRHEGSAHGGERYSNYAPSRPPSFLASSEDEDRRYRRSAPRSPPAGGRRTRRSQRSRLDEFEDEIPSHASSSPRIRREDAPRPQGLPEAGEEPLRSGHLWYLNVHSPPPFRWILTQAQLYPTQLLLRWYDAEEAGIGRGVVALDLITCTELRSVHDSASNDLGNVAARVQVQQNWPGSRTRDGIELTDVLRPFQLIYGDGVERLGAESPRKRAKWLKAIWDALSSKSPQQKQTRRAASSSGASESLYSVREESHEQYTEDSQTEYSRQPSESASGSSYSGYSGPASDEESITTKSIPPGPNRRSSMFYSRDEQSEPSERSAGGSVTPTSTSRPSGPGWFPDMFFSSSERDETLSRSRSVTPTQTATNTALRSPSPPPTSSLPESRSRQSQSDRRPHQQSSWFTLPNIFYDDAASQSDTRSYTMTQTMGSIASPSVAEGPSFFSHLLGGVYTQRSISSAASETTKRTVRWDRKPSRRRSPSGSPRSVLLSAVDDPSKATPLTGSSSPPVPVTSIYTPEDGDAESPFVPTPIPIANPRLRSVASSISSLSETAPSVGPTSLGARSRRTALPPVSRASSVRDDESVYADTLSTLSSFQTARTRWTKGVPWKRSPVTFYRGGKALLDLDDFSSSEESSESEPDRKGKSKVPGTSLDVDPATLSLPGSILDAESARSPSRASSGFTPSVVPSRKYFKSNASADGSSYSASTMPTIRTRGVTEYGTAPSFVSSRRQSHAKTMSTISSTPTPRIRPRRAPSISTLSSSPSSSCALFKIALSPTLSTLTRTPASTALWEFDERFDDERTIRDGATTIAPSTPGRTFTTTAHNDTTQASTRRSPTSPALTRGSSPPSAPNRSPISPRSPPPQSPPARSPQSSNGSRSRRHRVEPSIVSDSLTTLSDSRTITREDVDDEVVHEAVVEPPRELSKRAKAEKSKTKDSESGKRTRNQEKTAQALVS